MNFALIIPALALALPLHAAEPDAARLIQDIEGVYKHRFQNGLIVPGKPDETYTAEDVVEVVGHDDKHIYVRARLHFFNGHQCGIYGIAAFENGAFVYRDPERPLAGGEQCTLTVAARAGSLHLTDRATPDGASTCRAKCGVRGSLGDYSIASARKQKIRYLPRLKASRQYAEAINAFEGSRP